MGPLTLAGLAAPLGWLWPWIIGLHWLPGFLLLLAWFGLAVHLATRATLAALADG